MAKGMMDMEEYPDAAAPDEVGLDQGTGEDTDAAIKLAIETVPGLAELIEFLMDAAAPPAESPEDTVKANLQPGEFVIPEEVVREKGIGFFNKMIGNKEGSKAGGEPVKGGTEMAFSSGGYVGDDGAYSAGFVPAMHKDSGNNYADGGAVGEQYMKGPAGGSLWDRLTSGFLGEKKEAETAATIAPEQESELVQRARDMMEAFPNKQYYKDEYERLKKEGW